MDGLFAALLRKRAKRWRKRAEKEDNPKMAAQYRETAAILEREAAALRAEMVRKPTRRTPS